MFWMGQQGLSQLQSLITGHICSCMPAGRQEHCFAEHLPAGRDGCPGFQGRCHFWGALRSQRAGPLRALHHSLQCLCDDATVQPGGWLWNGCFLLADRMQVSHQVRPATESVCWCQHMWPVLLSKPSAGCVWCTTIRGLCHQPSQGVSFLLEAAAPWLCKQQHCE